MPVNQKGSILTGVLILLALLLLVAVPVLQAATVEYRASINAQLAAQAFYLAEAGLKHCQQEVISELSAGSATAPAPVSGAMGNGRYDATATYSDPDADGRFRVTIRSTGRVGTHVARSVKTSFDVFAGGYIPASGIPAEAAMHALHVQEDNGLIDDGKLGKSGEIIGPIGDPALFDDFYGPIELPDLGEKRPIPDNRYIENDGYYDGLDLSGRKHLTINTQSNRDTVVVFDHIDLDDGTIEVTGSGTLVIYVKGYIAVGKKSTLTSVSPQATVEIVCDGDLISIEQGDGSTGPVANRTLLYAPKATLELGNNANHIVHQGAVVVRELAAKDKKQLPNANKTRFEYSEEVFGAGAGGYQFGQQTWSNDVDDK
jgi:type II secretory pathway pseudopilin PulG